MELISAKHASQRSQAGRRSVLDISPAYEGTKLVVSSMLAKPVYGNIQSFVAAQVDPAFIAAETEIEMGKEDVKSRPEQHRCFPG